MRVDPVQQHRGFPLDATAENCWGPSSITSTARRTMRSTYRKKIPTAYERCDLVPNVLAGVESIDMSVTVMGQKIDMPLFLRTDCAAAAVPSRR